MEVLGSYNPEVLVCQICETMLLFRKNKYFIIPFNFFFFGRNFQIYRQRNFSYNPLSLRKVIIRLKNTSNRSIARWLQDHQGTAKWPGHCKTTGALQNNWGNARWLGHCKTYLLKVKHPKLKSLCWTVTYISNSCKTSFFPLFM